MSDSNEIPDGSWIKIPKATIEALRRQNLEAAMHRYPDRMEPNPNLTGVPVHIVNGEYFADLRPIGRYGEDAKYAQLQMFEALGNTLERGTVVYNSESEKMNVFDGKRWAPIDNEVAKHLVDGKVSANMVEELLAQMQEMQEEDERIALRMLLQAQQMEDDDERDDDAGADGEAVPGEGG